MNQKRCRACGSELRTVLASVQCETHSTRPSEKDHRIVPVPLHAGILPGPRFVTTCPSVIPFVIAAAFDTSINSTRFVLGCLKSPGMWGDGVITNGTNEFVSPAKATVAKSDARMRERISSLTDVPEQIAAKRCWHVAVVGQRFLAGNLSCEVPGSQYRNGKCRTPGGPGVEACAHCE